MMKKERRRSSAVREQPRKASTTGRNARPSRNSVTRRYSEKGALASSTVKRSSLPRLQDPSPSPSSTSAPAHSSPQSPDEAVHSPPEGTSASSPSASQRPPLGNGKRSRKEDSFPPSAGAALDRPRPSLPFAEPPRDHASMAAAYAPPPMPRLYASGSSSSALANSSGTAMSRGSSLRLSPSTSPAAQYNLMSPLNEIHGSMAQLYLTPISASLSSSTHQGFPALHFDGRSASWRSAGMAAANASNSAAAAAFGAQAGHRVSSGGIGPRPRNASVGDASSGPRHSGDTSSGAWASEDSFTQQQQLPWSRPRGPSVTAAARTRNSSMVDRRLRPTFSPDPHADVVEGHGMPAFAEMVDDDSAALSVTTATLLDTTATIAVPDTPPLPPPLRSTVPRASSVLRCPPTPPPLEGVAMPALGAAAAVREDGGADGRRGSWNLASSWAPAASLTSSVAGGGASGLLVVRPARRVSRGRAGSSVSGGSNSALELVEGEGEGASHLSTDPAHAGGQRRSETGLGLRMCLATGGAVADGSTTSEQHAMEDSMGSGSPGGSSTFSVSFSSAATSMFEELPPPPPAPPAQLYLSAGSGGRRTAPAASSAPLPLPPRASAANASVSLLLDDNVWHGKDRQRLNSASFSVRQASTASLFPTDPEAAGEGVKDPNSSLLFSSSHVSLTRAEPFTLTPPRPSTASSAGQTTAAKRRSPSAILTGATRNGGDGVDHHTNNSRNDDDDGGNGNSGSSLERHGAVYGRRGGSWSAGRSTDAAAGPPPFSLEPSAPLPAADTGAVATASAASGGAAAAPQRSATTPPPLPLGASAEADPFDGPSTGGQESAAAPPPPPEPALVSRVARPDSATRLTATGEGEESRQLELAQSFRNRIQVGVRAPRRKQTVRRVSASAGEKQRRGSTGSADGSGGGGGGTQRGSGGRGGSRRRSGSSRRAGARTAAAAGPTPFTFIRACMLMLACAKLMRAVTACRARHYRNEVAVPHATFIIQCAWRRHQQRRRIRERNAVRLLVPWARLHLQRLRKVKEVSALLLQRVFRGQVNRSLHRFLYARMQYNRALEVVLRVVRRWEAQKMLFRLRLQRDERVVLLEQCVQGCRQLFRAEQLAWTGLVDTATAELGTRPSVTTQDWVSGVAACTGLLLNPTVNGEDLFHVAPDTLDGTRAQSMPSRPARLHQQLVALSQLESCAYLNAAARTTKTGYLHDPAHASSSPLLASKAEGTVPPGGAVSVVSTSSYAELRRVTATGVFLPVTPLVMGDAQTCSAGDNEVSQLLTGAVTDDDVVVAYTQLLVRIEAAERQKLQRALLSEHEAVLLRPTLVNTAVSYVVTNQLPPLFAPLLLSMSSVAMMQLAVRLFAAEKAARCQIMAAYESMPLAFLSRPMLNPAAGQRHDNLVHLARRAVDPWYEAEQSERRLYHEWGTYQQRSTYYGTSDTKSISSPPVVFLQPSAGSLVLLPVMDEGVTPTPHLGATTPAPLSMNASPVVPGLFTVVSSLNSPRYTAVGPGGAGRLLRLGAAGLRGSPAQPALLSVPSTASTPRIAGSVCISHAPSDSYTRVDAVSRTAVPCPKRRQRGPPLPVLRKLVPPTTSGRAMSRLSRGPSFRSLSFLAHDDTPTSPAAGTGAAAGAVPGDGSDWGGFKPSRRPGASAPAALRSTAVSLTDPSSALGTPLAAPSLHPPLTMTLPLDESGVPLRERSVDGAAEAGLLAAAVANTTAVADTLYGSTTRRDTMQRLRGRLELQRGLDGLDGVWHDDDMDVFDGLRAARSPAASVNRQDRRGTAAPAVHHTPSFLPAHGGGRAALVAEAGEAAVFSPSRRSHVSVMPLDSDDTTDAGAFFLGTDTAAPAVTDGASPSGGIAMGTLSDQDTDDSPLARVLGGDEDGFPVAVTPHTDAKHPPLSPSSITSSSSSSSLSDSARTGFAGVGGRERSFAPRAPPQRPPTPPPRRCHAALAPSAVVVKRPLETTAATAVSWCADGSGAAHAAAKAVPSSTAAAAPRGVQTADSAYGERHRSTAGVAAAVQLSGKGRDRPSSSSSSSSSNTDWTLSPTIQTLTATNGSPISAFELPPTATPPVPRRAFAHTR